MANFDSNRFVKVRVRFARQVGIQTWRRETASTETFHEKSLKQNKKFIKKFGIKNKNLRNVFFFFNFFFLRS